MTEEAIQFFGEVDRMQGGRHRGMPTGEYPSWYFGTAVKSLKGEIESIERRFARDDIPPKMRAQMKAELKQKKAP